jgi:hypothetical protein
VTIEGAGVSGRAIMLAMAAALILQTAPARSYTGDEPSGMDMPRAIELSPRGADGLRLDIPGGPGRGECAPAADRTARRGEACRETPHVDALRPARAMPEADAAGHRGR